MKAYEWMAQAACRAAAKPAGFWFPRTEGNGVEEYSGPARVQAAEARSICLRCPVQAECREAGMTETFGIWGGMTERDRSRARKNRGRATPPTPKRCKGCGKSFVPSRPAREHCSNDCYQATRASWSSTSWTSHRRPA